MVWISVGDDQNMVSISEGFLPDLESLRAAQPKSPRYYRRPAPEFESVEAATAWTVTAFARRLAWYQRLVRDVDTLPLETYVLSRPLEQESDLAIWFEDVPEQRNYCVMIHRQPQRHGGRELRFHPWRKAYRDLSIRHRDGKYRHLKESGERVLASVLDAYREGSQRAASVIVTLGHAYWRSDGLFSPSSNSLDSASCDDRIQRRDHPPRAI